MRLQDIAKGGGNAKLTVLSEEELKSLHAVLLEILDDLHSICQENGLRYVLIGGSAIGALRSGGIIPWDDDIDIAMPRADFEKFTAIVREKWDGKYSMLHPQDADNFGRVIPKIRLRGTEYRTILEQDLTDCGVFIDIYTIENVPDNAITRTFQGVMAMGLGFCLACRRLYRGRKWFRQFDGGFSFKVKCAIGFCLSFASYETWARWTDHWHSRYKNENTRLVSIPADVRHFFGELNPREVLCQPVEVTFEGRKSFVPNEADSYLRAIYGDYMQIPPTEKQERNCYLNFDLGERRRKEEA
jgi:lipopolysaccharide cholinephosphotransferase